MQDEREGGFVSNALQETAAAQKAAKRIATSRLRLSISNRAPDQLIARVESGRPVPQPAAPDEKLVAAIDATETVQQAAAASETVEQFIDVLEPNPNPLQLHLQRAFLCVGAWANFTQLLNAQAIEALANARRPRKT